MVEGLGSWCFEIGRCEGALAGHQECVCARADMTTTREGKKERGGKAGRQGGRDLSLFSR